MRERISKLEVSVAVLSGVIVFIATLTEPRLSHGVSRDTRAVTHARQDRQISELEAALQAAQEEGRTLQTQRAEAGLQLEELRSELAALKQERETLGTQLAALKQERETLGTQLAASVEEVRELGEKMQAADQEATKTKDLLLVQEANRARDEAEARAEKAQDRIRELTLELHRAGIWP